MWQLQDMADGVGGVEVQKGLQDQWHCDQNNVQRIFQNDIALERGDHHRRQ